MSVLRNVALMGTSTALRLGFGLLTFVAMARMLGPEPFGQVMLWLSVATLLTLVANFGFTPYVLREIGVRPQEATRVMSEVLTAKLLLSALVAVLGLLSVAWLETDTRIVFVALLVATLADAMTEFFNVGFRATNRFADETRLASVASLLQFSIVALAVWWVPSAEAAAAAFMLSRILVLVMTRIFLARFFSGLSAGALAAGIGRIRATAAYAADFGLQSLFGQIDSLVLNHYAGSAAVGIYQAGMRLFNGGAQGANVLASVFLPRAARVADDAGKLGIESARMQWAFVGIGLGFGILLAVAAKPLVLILFGAEFSALIDVLPWLGLLFFVRFFAASWGVVLTSAGQQRFRAIANLFQWVVVLACAVWLVPRWGVVAWVWCLVLGNLILAIAYCVRGMQLAGVRPSQPLCAGLASLMFLPFLHLPMLLLAP